MDIYLFLRKTAAAAFFRAGVSRLCVYHEDFA